MTSSELKAKLERLERSPRIVPLPSGSPAIVSIRIGPDLPRVDSIAAIALLKQSGLGLLHAKRTIEDVLSGGTVLVALPKVADNAAVQRNLIAAGFITSVKSWQLPDVQTIRERLGLTQEQFALRFGLELDAVRNWEHRRRIPDAAARSLLKVIARFPDAVAAAQDETSGPS